MMRVLAIESSCDDTAAAVIDGHKVLSSIVASQNDVHARFGGVVPELASRSHMRSISRVIRSALEAADLNLDQIEGIAATSGPGLVGSLLVGLSAAKGIAFARHLPFVAINHLEGHLLSILLTEEAPFPFVALLVSGGHTSLYLASNPGEYRLLGATRDDAAGEAYDKVAKMLGLGFPGGPKIDKLAVDGNGRAIRFPRARLKVPRSLEAPFEFSFSGLKTAVWQHLRDHPLGTPADPQAAADIAASFQEAAVDMLLTTAVAALDHVGATRLVIAGGVSANTRLRARAQQVCAERGAVLHIPPIRFCTDNAAMIGLAGAFRLERGERDPLTVNASADLEL